MVKYSSRYSNIYIRKINNLILATLFGGAKIVFFHPRLRSNQGGLRYFTGHVGMPAELRDNALSIQRP